MGPANSIVITCDVYTTAEEPQAGCSRQDVNSTSQNLNIIDAEVTETHPHCCTQRKRTQNSWHAAQTCASRTHSSKTPYRIHQIRIFPAASRYFALTSSSAMPNVGGTEQMGHMTTQALPQHTHAKLAGRPVLRALMRVRMDSVQLWQQNQISDWLCTAETSCLTVRR